MRKFLDRYYGTLRKIKANYVLLNIFNLKKLAHARRMYKKYGIQRSVLLPISSIDLPATPATELPWLDTPEGIAKLTVLIAVQSCASQLGQRRACRVVELQHIGGIGDRAAKVSLLLSRHRPVKPTSVAAPAPPRSARAP